MNVMTMAKPRKVSMGNTPGVARRAKANRNGQRRMQGSGRTDGGGATGRVAADIRITIVVVKKAARAFESSFLATGLLPVGEAILIAQAFSSLSQAERMTKRTKLLCGEGIYPRWGAGATLESVIAQCRENALYLFGPASQASGDKSLRHKRQSGPCFER
ncbi:hypothetical protein J3P84_00480 [Pseudomonas sp. Z1-29]|uniref:hypothetical protein n=1 Tax=Pseudomonas sp. Z1-29 TaxID=2817410 RepID=UPI003DA95848